MFKSNNYLTFTLKNSKNKKKRFIKNDKLLSNNLNFWYFLLSFNKKVLEICYYYLLCFLPQ